MADTNNDDSKKRIPYEKPQLFDLGGGVAYAASPPACPTGSQAAGGCGTGGNADSGDCTNGGAAPGGLKCDNGGTATSGTCCKGGSAAIHQKVC